MPADGRGEEDDRKIAWASYNISLLQWECCPSLECISGFCPFSWSEGGGGGGGQGIKLFYKLGECRGGQEGGSRTRKINVHILPISFAHFLKRLVVEFVKYRTERSDPYQEHVLDTFCTSTNTRSTFRFCLIL